MDEFAAARADVEDAVAVSEDRMEAVEAMVRHRGGSVEVAPFGLVRTFVVLPVFVGIVRGDRLIRGPGIGPDKAAFAADHGAQRPAVTVAGAHDVCVARAAKIAGMVGTNSHGGRRPKRGKGHGGDAFEVRVRGDSQNGEAPRESRRGLGRVVSNEAHSKKKMRGQWEPHGTRHGTLRVTEYLPTPDRWDQASFFAHEWRARRVDGEGSKVVRAAGAAIRPCGESHLRDCGHPETHGGGLGRPPIESACSHGTRSVARRRRREGDDHARVAPLRRGRRS